MKKKANLNRKQLAVIHATHGHRDGGLSLFDVKTKNAYGVQHLDGDVYSLGRDQINICLAYGWDYILPEARYVKDDSSDEDESDGYSDGYSSGDYSSE